VTTIAPPGTPEAAHLDDLAAFISASPSPFHAVETARSRLAGAGFQIVDESLPWSGGPGRWMVVRGGALVAWSTERTDPSTGFRIIGAHTDSPNLRIRPRPDRTSAGFRQLGVEVYGGVLLNSWLDRDLGLSGRVAVRGPDGSTSIGLVHIDEPILRVPQLAIHLDRSIAADGLRLDPQAHMVPVWGTHLSDEQDFRTWLAERLDVSPGDVLSWDVMAHDLTPPARLGRDRSMFAAPRLDNLLSCHAGTAALIAAAASDSAAVPVLCLFDHEEVGSETASGAGGSLLPTILERIGTGAGLDLEATPIALARSMCISADGAHATHPNWPARHDPDHPVLLDAGPVLKHNANARYATDAVGAGHLVALAADAGIPLQQFVARGDLPCGSTIGPVTAARLGMTTVDIGVAQLSMHSAREMCGVIDPFRFATLLHAFVESDRPLPTA
jgi:aspartyl aminopeptidase